MATHYKALVDVKGTEYRLILWSNKNPVSKDDPFTIESIRDELKKIPQFSEVALVFTVKKVIECDAAGNTTISDEYQIIYKNGMLYGFIEKGLGQSNWNYINPNNQRLGHPAAYFNGKSFELVGNYTYQSQWFTQNLPAKATIDWDRLEIHCEGDILDLEVTNRYPQPNAI